MTTDTQTSKKEIVCSYETYEGAIISIPSGQAFSFTQKKLEQLQAINWMMVHDQIGCGTSEGLILHQIADSLAQELGKLLPIVHAEAAKGCAS